MKNREGFHLHALLILVINLEIDSHDDSDVSDSKVHIVKFENYWAIGNFHSHE